jgi:hypothetical protein
MTNQLEAHWEDFRTSMLLGMDPEVVTKVRNVFFTGAMVAFAAMTDAIASGDVRRVMGMKEELDAWHQSLLGPLPRHGVWH